MRAQNLLLSRIVRPGHNHRSRERLSAILYPSPELVKQRFGLTTLAAPAVSESRDLVILIERSNVAYKVRYLIVILKRATRGNARVSLGNVSLKSDLEYKR